MSEIGQARDLVKAALFGLPEQMRPQDAAELVADVEYLVPALAALIDQINRRLGDAERLPGLYSTTSADARTVLNQSRGQLRTACDAIGSLSRRLEEAHQGLASLGHGDTGHHPLRLADE